MLVVEQNVELHDGREQQAEGVEDGRTRQRPEATRQGGRVVDDIGGNVDVGALGGGGHVLGECHRWCDANTVPIPVTMFGTAVLDEQLQTRPIAMDAKKQ